MAEKMSFLLYMDDLELLEELTMEERGQLLTAVYCHTAGLELPEMSSTARVAFIVIRKKLDRDAAKYAQQVAKNHANGSKGGRPKKKKTEDDEEESEPERETDIHDIDLLAGDRSEGQENPTITQKNPEKPTGFSEGVFDETENPTITQKNMISDKCKVISDICTPLSGGNTRTRTREDAAWLESLPIVLNPAQMSEVDSFLKRGAEKDLITWAVGEAISRSKGWEYARAIVNDKLMQGIRTCTQLRCRGAARTKTREKPTSYDGEAFDRLWLELPPVEA